MINNCLHVLQTKQSLAATLGPSFLRIRVMISSGKRSKSPAPVVVVVSMVVVGVVVVVVVERTDAKTFLRSMLDYRVEELESERVVVVFILRSGQGVFDS